MPLLYLERYVDMIRDETNPFEAGVRDLDQVSVGDVLKGGRIGGGGAILRRVRIGFAKCVGRRGEETPWHESGRKKAIPAQGRQSTHDGRVRLQAGRPHASRLSCLAD